MPTCHPLCHTCLLRQCKPVACAGWWGYVEFANAALEEQAEEVNLSVDGHQIVLRAPIDQVPVHASSVAAATLNNPVAGAVYKYNYVQAQAAQVQAAQAQTYAYASASSSYGYDPRYYGKCRLAVLPHTAGLVHKSASARVHCLGRDYGRREL